MPNAHTEPENEINASPDVASPVVIQTLSLLWIALFGGHWIVVSLLQWNSMVSPEQVAAFDADILSRVYLILLALTILVVALRVARRYSAPSAASPTGKAEAKSASLPDSRQESRKL